MKEFYLLLHTWKALTKVLVITLLFLINFSFAYSQATLPVNRTSWAVNPPGWTDSLSGYLLDPYACTTNDAAAFDQFGTSWKKVHFSGVATELKFKLRSSNSMGLASFWVYESADNVNWVQRQFYGFDMGTGLPVNDCADVTLSLGPSIRYIKFTFQRGNATFYMDDVRITGLATVSSATDHFRSAVATGLWNATSSWESSPDGNTWSASTLVPTSSANTITIQSGHTINVTSPASLDQTTINGNLIISNNTGSLTINDGVGDDLTIAAGGMLKTHCSRVFADEFQINSGAIIHVQANGKITVGNGAGGFGGFNDLAIINSVIWDNSAIFDWNTINAFTSGNIVYFPNAGSAVPIFRVSTTPGSGVGAGTPTTFNGILEVYANITFNNSGIKVFRNGIRGTHTITQNAGAGSFNLTGPTAVLDGLSLRVVLVSQMNLAPITIVPSGAVVTVSGAGLDNAGRDLTIDGALDITSIAITNSSSGEIFVNGIIRTSHAGGLTGGGSSIPSTAGTVTLNNATSTVDYYAAVNQIVTGRDDYFNIILRNGGTKTLSSASDGIAGTVTIQDNTIFNVANRTFGSSPTKLVMTGTSRFINTGSGVKPDMGGLYTLGIGTTIEFSTSTAATTIRLSPQYANLVISGDNISTSSVTASLKFQPGGTFTVKNGGVFKVVNNNGFSGATNTVIDITNNPSIILEAGSTIEYNGGNQQITNAAITTPANSHYQNLTINGMGIKTAPAGILKIAGNLGGSGSSFAHNNGTLQFNGSVSQSYLALTPFTFYNVIVDNPVEVVASSSLSLIRELSFTTNGKLRLNSVFTLLSSDTATANVGKMTASNIITYGTGKFQVERFIATGTTAGRHPKSWQLLSIPTYGMNESVNAAWQEGQAPLAVGITGYGTTITSEKPGAVSRGYDFHTPAGPSIKTFDNSTQDWKGIDDGVTNTNAKPIANEKGYMILVRGDRQVQTFDAAANPVILRTSGKIYSPADVPPVVTIPLAGFGSVGNPYASAIDLTTLNRSGVNDKYYVWDPRLTTAGPNSVWGLGGWRTLTRNGSTYDVTPPDVTGSYGATTKFIQSGQAFLVESTGNGTITFDEDDKVSGSALVARQEVMVSTRISAELFVTVNNSPVQLDGVLSRFHSSFENDIDGNDASKMTNTGESIAIRTNDKKLAVEKRNNLFVTDTIFYVLSNLRKQTYTLKISATDMAGMDAMLVDNFSGKRIQLNSGQNLDYPFTITDDAASSASDRFYITLNNKLYANTNTGNAIVVSPNPIINRQINFRLLQSGKYAVSLTNAAGQTILKREIESTSSGLNIVHTSATPGVYVLSVTDQAGVNTSQRVIIQ